MTVEIRLLGPIEVHTANGTISAVDFRSKKSQRVFEVLALAGGQTVSKDALVDILWRQRTPDHPAATVEVAVSLLRSTLGRIGAASAVLTEPGGYRLDPAVVTIDALTFDHALVTAEHRSDAERVELLRPALAMVRGVLLADEPALDWLAPHRERSRRRVELARLLLARSALACGDESLAFETAESAWMQADVVLEDAYAIGAEALLVQGRRSEAAALLLAADRRLQLERSTTAGPALLAVREQLERPFELRAGSARVPIGPLLAALPSPLPFLGRRDLVALADRAVRDVLAAITDKRNSAVRWLHIEGGRGAGKSRLLEQLEQDLPGEHPSVVIHRLTCATGDAGVESLFAVRLARVMGERGVAVDAALFARLAETFDAIGPAVLLIDDLHLADGASVAVLRSLAAPGGAASLLVVSAGGVAPAVARSVRLGRLTPDELAPLGDREFCEGVWAATAGHPAVLAACARAAVEGGLLDRRGTQDLRSIAGDLGPIPGVVVSLAAQSEGPMSLSDISALTGIGAAELDLAVEALAVCGVLRRQGDECVELQSSLFRALFRR